MSYFPEDNMGFFDTIQVFFMELTGRSLIFSGRDLQLLYSWRMSGATARMICQGVDDAIKAMSPQEPPRDIYTCRRYIESQLDRVRHSIGHVASPVDENPQPKPMPDNSIPVDPIQRTLQKVEELGRNCQDDAVKDIYRSAWQEIRRLNEENITDEDVFERLLAVEDAFIDRYFAMLEEGIQQTIERQIFNESVPYLARMTEDARAEHLTARRRLLLKRAPYALPSFVD